MTCNVRSAALKLGHAVRQTEGNDGAIRPVATVTLYDPTVEQTLALGDAVRLAITGPCARCVMTTLPQADLPKDAGILRAAAQYNRANVGVYASVLQGGKIRRGEVVRLE